MTGVRDSLLNRVVGSIACVLQHAGGDAEKQLQVAPVSRASPVLLAFAWCCLLVGTLATSAVGPSFLVLSLQGVQPLVAVVWRASCSLVLLAPMLAVELIRTPSKDMRAWARWPALWSVFAAGVSWSVSLCLWVVALQFTTAVRASLFTALSPLAIICKLYFSGEPVSRGELGGVAVSTLGTFVCVLASSAEREAQGATQTVGVMLLGDAMCLLSACFTAADYIYSARARQSVPLVTFTFMSTALVAASCAVMAVIFEGATLGADGNGGAKAALTGWLSDDFRSFVIFMSLFIGVFGILGYNISLKYIAPLLLSIVGLTEPALTGVITWAVGMEALPTTGTWMGGSLVLAGTFLAMTYGNHH